MFEMVIMLFYRVLYLPLLLIGLPFYLVRSWHRGEHGKGFRNRFGLIPNLCPKGKKVKRIWIQAASVGELNAIQPLLQRLSDNGDIEIILTTNTSTGLRVIEEKLAKLTAWYGPFPFDFWACSTKAWSRIDPDLVVLMEGELWPEHIHQAKRRNVPVILINARMSDKSFKRHYPFRNLTKLYFSKLDRILAGSGSDRKRFISLGWIDDSKVLAAGNLKMDMNTPDAPDADERQSQLAEFGIQHTSCTLLLGSSTWSGEEEILAQAYMQLKLKFPALHLVLVPRHFERKALIEKALQPLGESVHYRSDHKQAPEGTSIYVADTTGELGNLTRFADIVFVGRSLPPNAGGQTPLEAAAAGKPLVFGPDMSNFKDISRQLLDANAALSVASPDDLVPALEKLLADPETLSRMGANSLKCVERNRGATERVLSEILEQVS